MFVPIGPKTAKEMAKNRNIQNLEVCKIHFETLFTFLIISHLKINVEKI